MDEMKLRLTTTFMKKIAAKLLSRAIYKKTGCKVNIQLNDLDINIMDGDTKISTNIEVNFNSKEFSKLMNAFDLDD